MGRIKVPGGHMVGIVPETKPDQRLEKPKSYTGKAPTKRDNGQKAENKK